LDTRRSDEIYRRARELLPGGVNSPVRAMRSIGRDPIFVERGEGCELVDVDGNRYVDWVCSWGPLILGHADPDVVAAVRAAAGRGTSFGAPTEAETELAAEVAGRFASVEMVRMVSSGTEAAMSAVRLARAVTGRDAVVKFAGAYHGHSDGLLAEGGSGLATQGTSPTSHASRSRAGLTSPTSHASRSRAAPSLPASPGVTAAQAADTAVVAWNDFDAVKAAVAERPTAAILAEPIAANMGVVPPADGFLRHLRTLADDHGALLIADEVITGFRVARGGAQELYGVPADVTVMGKVLGGGLPAAAYGGSRELMNRVAPAGDVYQAGTLSGNPLATAAGLATLRKLGADAYRRLGELTDRLADGLRDAAGGHAVEIASAPGLVTPFFSEGPVLDFAAAARCDADAHARFCRALLERGIYPPPSQFEAWFVSLAHDEAAIDRTAAAAEQAFGEAFA
jgi:glutamate-1-semialdehyde 2,1-aminomutase